MLELLLAVAIALTHQPTLVIECGALPVPKTNGVEDLGNASSPWTDGLPHIWMRPWICKSAYARKHTGLKVFAHEMLHIRPNRSEEWTQKWDDWYAENVVRWKMNAIAARGP